MEKVGAEDVTLLSTGHEKQNVTVGLAFCSDGTKLKPYVVFKGKAMTAEDKGLKKLKDINVDYTDNGWFNSDVSFGNGCLSGTHSGGIFRRMSRHF